jgi:hypothetical protein
MIGARMLLRSCATLPRLCGASEHPPQVPLGVRASRDEEPQPKREGVTGFWHASRPCLSPKDDPCIGPRDSQLELESAIIFCESPIVVGHFKSCIAVLMSVLAIGIWTPLPACAAIDQASPSCCSPEGQCHSQPNALCGQSCVLTHVPSSDLQAPSRMAVGSAAPYLPLTIAPVEIEFPAFVSVVRTREANTSPPFGGGPPQAVLRLWLI